VVIVRVVMDNVVAVQCMVAQFTLVQVPRVLRKVVTVVAVQAAVFRSADQQGSCQGGGMLHYHHDESVETSTMNQ